MDLQYFLYCVVSAYTDQWNLRKLGLTIHPVHRMQVYNTGDAPGIGLEKRYGGIWQVNAKTKAELRRLEEQLHTRFNAVRMKKAGKNTEWFTVSLEEVAAFLNSQSYVIRQLSIEEVQIIQEKSHTPPAPDDAKAIEEEMNLMTEEMCKQNTCVSLKEEFFATFLPSSVPRRIQTELWDIWEKISSSSDTYSGIVQWATGTGKTIALLLLFVLSADAAKRQGKVFRGLLIAPKNDIFDTIIHHIRKLSIWGITVCEGHNARLSSLHIPLKEHILLTATHASLTESDVWDKLPSITHCHYDEVHRITGEEFYALLQVKLNQWNTPFLTGTSATPKTCAISQHKKIAGLFGTPLRIIHKCDVDEAIHEGWIAQPRFGVHIMSNTAGRNSILRVFVNTIRQSILDKKAKGPWKGGKVIAYLSFRKEVCDAVALAKEIMPEWHIYTAVEDADAWADDTFVSDPDDGQPRILFACERYREGSDIRGLEMTVVLMGNTIASNILLQIAGRALRNDYEGKEGWCIIVRPSEEGTTEDDVFDCIVLQIMEFIGKEDVTTPTKEKIKRVVEKFFGDVAITGKVYNVDETVHRIQLMYARKEYERADPKEKYGIVRALNKDMGLVSKDEYEARASEHIKYIDKPTMYFEEWISWYDFLGVDTSAFPHTKSEWIRVCKQMGIASWSQYKEKHGASLPANPGEMYGDYTNWDKEFGVEEEIVW